MEEEMKEMLDSNVAFDIQKSGDFVSVTCVYDGSVVERHAFFSVKKELSDCIHDIYDQWCLFVSTYEIP